MGQPLSQEEKRAIKMEVYSFYPGLEQQLEMAFACHDLDGEGRQPYTILEPVIRHLIMQYGLIEFVTRLSDENGHLDPAHVNSELHEFGVNIGGGLCGNAVLSCEQFKSLAVVWLRKILETHRTDQAEWLKRLQTDQEAQTDAYMKAMKNFQEKYTSQQALYQQGLEEQQKQISEWNKLLEDTQRTQQEVYEAEVRRMQEIRHREENAEREKLREQDSILEQYHKKLAQIASEDTNGTCFVYPAACTPYGACASAGAQEPVRRPPQPKLRNRTKHHAVLC